MRRDWGDPMRGARGVRLAKHRTLARSWEELEASLDNLWRVVVAHVGGWIVLVLGIAHLVLGVEASRSGNRELGRLALFWGALLVGFAVPSILRGARR